MKSKAHFKSHPLHPMLVAFPVAFLYGSLVADAVGLLIQGPSWWMIGAYLSIAAVVSGLVAAVPGLIDYVNVVPPNSSAKKRATLHMAVNVTALSCFAMGGVFRDWTSLQPAIVTVLLELGGVGLVTFGGFLGGTLVYRNQIGVDHRYAFAGKWQEQKVDGTPGQAVPVAAKDELKPGQMKLLVVGSRRIVLARTDKEHVAFDDRCTHRGGSLADGVLICATVQCPWHGSQFDTGTGKVLAGPAEQGIGTYEVEEKDGQVRLTIPQGP